MSMQNKLETRVLKGYSETSEGKQAREDVLVLLKFVK